MNLQLTHYQAHKSQ